MNKSNQESLSSDRLSTGLESIPSSGLIYFGPGPSRSGIPLGSAHVETCTPRHMAAHLPPYTLCCPARGIGLTEIASLQRNSGLQSINYNSSTFWDISLSETPPYLVHRALLPPFHALALNFMSPGRMLKMISHCYIRTSWVQSVSASLPNQSGSRINIDGRYPPFGGETRRDIPWESTMTGSIGPLTPTPTRVVLRHVQEHPLEGHPHSTITHPAPIDRSNSMDLPIFVVPSRSRSMMSIESHTPRRRIICVWIEKKTGIHWAPILLVISVIVAGGLIAGISYGLSKVLEGPLDLRPH